MNTLAWFAEHGGPSVALDPTPAPAHVEPAAPTPEEQQGPAQRDEPQTPPR
ncbi:MAG: hypothetical protein AB7T08_11045 [Hyphomonadaceae bacterium]